MLEEVSTVKDAVFLSDVLDAMPVCIFMKGISK
jgi:hypothetical protein